MSVAPWCRTTPPAQGAALIRRVSRQMNLLGWGAGALGGSVTFMVIGSLIGLFELPQGQGWIAARDGPVVLLYLLIYGKFSTIHDRRHLGRTLAWLREGRPPTDREHRATLMLALRAVKYDAIGWSIAGLFFGLYDWLALGLDPGFSAAVAITIWLGGDTTCALVYLAAERIHRPLVARALAARPTDTRLAPGVRLRLSMAWALGTGIPLIGVLAIAVGGGHHHGAVAPIVFLTAIALVTGLVATLFAAHAIADPLNAVRAGLERVRRGDLEVVLPVDDGSEVGHLQAGFNEMAEGLRERERIRDLFGRQVGADVARAALDRGVRLGGEEREIGALFIDLVGSTSMTLSMPPAEVVRILNRFFRVVVDAVEAAGGFVNKFEGDAALCVFGAPVPCADPAGDALRAARELAARLHREVPEVDFGVGVSSGVAVAGNVGAEQRFEYTVIGDPVNEAARLAELAKAQDGRVVAAGRALDAAREAEAAAWRHAEPVFLRGRAGATVLARPKP